MVRAAVDIPPNAFANLRVAADPLMKRDDPFHAE